MNKYLFVLFRIYCLTLGRLSFFSKLLRKVLVRTVIDGKKHIYTAANQYFDPRELS